MSDEIHEEILDAKNLPPDWWRRGSVLNALNKHFAPHLLGLHIMGQVKNKMQHGIYSGFVFQNEGKLFWGTAGHVLDHFNELLNSPDFKFHSAEWMDGCKVSGAEAIHANEFYLSPMLSMTNTGIDFGVISLEPVKFTIQNSKLTRPFDSSIWIGIAGEKAEGYYLLGFPGEWNKVSDTGNATHHRTQVEAGIAIVPLDVATRPSEFESTEQEKFWSHPDHFYAKLPKVGDYSPTLEKIEGTSGGLIIAIDRVPPKDLRYRILGIQSAWLPDSRILRAVPMEIVRETFKKYAN